MTRKYRQRRVIRKIRWKRVLLLLTILCVFVGVLAGVAAVYTVPVTVSKHEKRITQKKLVDKESVTILIAGIDQGDPQNHAAARTDALVLANINPSQSRITLLSVPRDTQVALAGQKGTDKINHAYFYGGVERSVSAVSELLGISVHHYVVMDIQGFSKLIDALGGIEMYVDRDMEYEDHYGDLKIHLKKGFQKLSGDQASQYVRFRSDELGDIGRVKRQQKFFAALSEMLWRPGTWLNANAVKTAAAETIRTDLTTAGLLQLAYLASACKRENTQFVMLPGQFAVIGGVSYWQPNLVETQQLVTQYFTAGQH